MGSWQLCDQTVQTMEWTAGVLKTVLATVDYRIIRTALLRHGMYGSVTIAIVLQGQLDYCTRAKSVLSPDTTPRTLEVSRRFLAEVLHFHVLLRAAVVP